MIEKRVLPKEYIRDLVPSTIWEQEMIVGLYVIVDVQPYTIGNKMCITVHVRKEDDVFTIDAKDLLNSLVINCFDSAAEEVVYPPRLMDLAKPDEDFVLPNEFRVITATDKVLTLKIED